MDWFLRKIWTLERRKEFGHILFLQSCQNLGQRQTIKIKQISSLLPHSYYSILKENSLLKMHKLLFILLAILANSAFSCRHNGVTYRNGDEWMERNAFVMRCTIHPNGSWRTEVVACTLPDGRRVPINTAIEDGNDEWRCEMNDQGMVTLVQGANPNARCEGRPVGSVWREKSFELECRPGGYRRLVGCVTEDGQRIAVNGTREVNGFTMVCQQFGNGTVIFHGTKTVRPAESIQRYGQPLYPQYGSSSSSSSDSSPSNGVSIRCNDENGYARNVGEYWVENHRFNKTCRPNGAVEVANCVSKDGYRIPLNGQLIRDGAKYSCEMTPQGTIRFAAGPVDE